MNEQYEIENLYVDETAERIRMLVGYPVARRKVSCMRLN